MTDFQEHLLAHARRARSRAYAPYSRFAVGASVHTLEGHTFVGANVENASYGLSICAERSAFLQAVLSGEKRITTVAVFSACSPPAVPCGMCLQTIAEFAKGDCTILVGNEQGERAKYSLDDLLPVRFEISSLSPYSDR